MIDINYGSDGLVPVVVQSAVTGEVLMVAYANEQSIKLTQETGYAHFYSRSRSKLWKKGETSGNTLKICDMEADCDQDCVLMQVIPSGPVCHTGARSCFSARSAGAGIADDLYEVLKQREKGNESTYTADLLAQGLGVVSKKIGEEAAEVIWACSSESDDRVISEVADLWFFTIMALCLRDVHPAKVWEELMRRRGDRSRN